MSFSTIIIVFRFGSRTIVGAGLRARPTLLFPVTIECMAHEKPPGPLHPDRVVDPKTVPFADPRYRGNLPHLYKPGCSYFVTFCLFDVPGFRAKTREQLTTDDPQKLALSSEPSPAGSCLLANPESARIVENALLHFQGDRYALSAWCVMPNHVHAVVTPFGTQSLLEVLHSWKSYTANTIIKSGLHQGSVWQDETFDHLIRNPAGFDAFVAYTEHNPVAAGLVDRPKDWEFSSARFRSEEDG